MLTCLTEDNTVAHYQNKSKFILNKLTTILYILIILLVCLESYDYFSTYFINRGSLV